MLRGMERAELQAAVQGEVVFMRIFDLGGTVDVKKLEASLGLAAAGPAVEASRAAPEYVSFATLNDLYQTIVDYLQTRQNVILEWTIVLLIVFEIVMAFLRM